VLRRLAWGIGRHPARLNARGEQPPFGYPAVLSVDDIQGAVSAADLAVNDHLLTGLG